MELFRHPLHSPRPRFTPGHQSLLSLPPLILFSIGVWNLYFWTHTRRVVVKDVSFSGKSDKKGRSERLEGEFVESSTPPKGTQVEVGERTGEPRVRSQVES